MGNSHIPGYSTEFAIWDGEKFKYLDAVKYAYEINNEGIVLGKQQITTEEGMKQMLVLYDVENDTTQEVMNHTDLVSFSLNDRCEVIAVKQMKSHTQIDHEGFLWSKEAGSVGLGDFIPFALNNNGQMVGYTPEGAVFWDHGNLVNIITPNQMPMKFLGLNDHGVAIGRLFRFEEKFVSGRSQMDDRAYVLVPE